MDAKERDIRENESREKHEERLNQDINRATDPDQIAESLKANGKNMKRKDTGKNNRLWLWLGVIILIFIILYWLFVIGTFGDMMNWFNG